MDPDLQRVAVALFRAVTGDFEASWATMSDEERDDASEWARVARAELTP